MNCPNCNVALVMSERQGIEIDYCPTCRGVWLDRGELDKIIEKSTQPANDMNYQPKQQFDNRNRNDMHGNQGQHDYYKNQRKKSWLNELFD
jgi:Zn-finger nucleic acid-binding protein